jgi:cyclic di-GMP phosphodiesterase
MKADEVSNLIVDDDATNRKLLGRYLSNDYRCSVAQAKDLLTDNPVRLAIIDLKIPGASGIELCSALKENPLCQYPLRHFPQIV